MKSLVASVLFAVGLAFTAGCATSQEEAASSEQAIGETASASFTPMLKKRGFDRLEVNGTDNTAHIVLADGTRVSLSAMTVQTSSGTLDLLVAKSSDGSRATMYTKDNWPIITTRHTSHILFHAAASVGEELDYWKGMSSASFALAGMVLDTMGSLYGVQTEAELTTRLTDTGAVPGIGNSSSTGSGSGAPLRTMQKAPTDDEEIPVPLTEQEFQVLEVKKQTAVFTRDCVGPFVGTIISALAVSWSCRLCARMITATIASAAGGPVAIVTLLGTAASCGICAVTMYSTIKGAVDTYNGCVNGQVTDPFNNNGGGGGPIPVPVEVASVPVN